ncbi:GNAT family N-acetyltransferase [Blastococcus sp. KM273128]|uniref:GNAT family N-acetyltransferase n=1 Tax=Blastococcus sp. KM273128 TaxID=2570314 RepID=UPI001F4098B9|nr:GNAT family protein [Blastococcus sp. KM273128]MCF6743511.1 GNAT family N-acetyltransferase [Blastococcus sp. KM273128]
MHARTRLLALDDAPALADLVRADQEFQAPWEPARDERWYTEAGQRDDVRAALDRHEAGLALPCVVLDEAGAVAGRVNLNNVVRGAFQSASLGYWVASASDGRGLATGAVAEMLRRAFTDLGLHRVEAGTLLHNAASQKVLERNGFTRYGLAPRYLRIAGRWQDHVLFQVLAPGTP